MRPSKPGPAPMKPANVLWVAVAAGYVVIVRTLIVRSPWCGAHPLATTTLVGVVGCALILAVKWAADKQARGDH
ncbi:hypothetical protein [uncultured Caulobacter sp.]|uniref:hypothetical protein n=1 Tax=uncultured Caulobacter sp. TaxID=158749 RepID=UPI002631BF86|nr:hypothetical protein [uncultured Caulobacter sp.]